MNLNDLETFLLVVEVGTFTGAADALGVPKSTVSRRVARLEEELDRALLNRSSRSFEVSDDGRALYERCAPALREIAGVERDLLDSEATPRGQVRLTASIDFGTTRYLGELLGRYACLHPEVRVELQLTNRLVDLLEENIDVGFRTHSRPLASRDDLVARRIGTLEIGAYASPGYLERHGRPASPADLPQHRAVTHGKATIPDWGMNPVVSADDYRPVAAVMAAGAGLGVLPDFVAASYVEEGRLVRILPEWELEPATLSLVWLRSRHLAPRIRAFIDLAIAEAHEGALR